jgi:chorismate mutase
MFFEGMDKMSLSEQCELQEAWYGGVDLKSSWFYSLKTLKLDNCDIEPYAVPSNILPYLNSLKELEVRDCNKVKVIFAKNDAKAIPSQLNNLTLSGLSELEHVWEKNCRGNLRFQNLQQVLVTNCKGLKSFFPAALAKNLKKLEKLEIGSCQNLTDIIGKEEVGVADAAEKFLFPCLTSLKLYYLRELTYFYPEIFNVECRELHELLVLECPNLELFQSSFTEGEGESSSISINRQPLFSDIKVSNVESLISDA